MTTKKTQQNKVPVTYPLMKRDRATRWYPLLLLITSRDYLSFHQNSIKTKYECSVSNTREHKLKERKRACVCIAQFEGKKTQRYFHFTAFFNEGVCDSLRGLVTACSWLCYLSVTKNCQI